MKPGCAKVYERQKWSKVPVVLGEARAQSSLRIPCFTATLYKGTPILLGLLYNVKWVHLDPTHPPDPVIRDSAAGQNLLLEMQLCKYRGVRVGRGAKREGINKLCSLHSAPQPPS